MVRHSSDSGATFSPVRDLTMAGRSVNGFQIEQVGASVCVMSLGFRLRSLELKDKCGTRHLVVVTFSQSNSIGRQLARRGALGMDMHRPGYLFRLMAPDSHLYRSKLFQAKSSIFE